MDSDYTSKNGNAYMYFESSTGKNYFITEAVANSLWENE